MRRVKNKMTRGDVEYQIQNVVMTAKVANMLNLIDLHKSVDGAVYEPGKFPALRLRQFGAGFLLYSSGSVVCTGSKSPEGAKEKVMNLIKMLKKHKVKTLKDPTLEVRNIVASVDLKKELNLHNLSYIMEESEYNPEAFPGMKVKKDATRLLVFRTGKAILPGLRSVDEVEETIDWLYTRLEEAEKEVKLMKA